MFTRRLILLNNDKFGVIVKHFSEKHEMFDTLDKEEWNNLQADMIKANALMSRKRSLQILNEIRSEISSERNENQSQVGIFMLIS